MSFALISFFTSGGGGAIRNQISPGIGSASIKVRLSETTEEEEEFNLGGQKKKGIRYNLGKRNDCAI